jgi:hypothetical protein
VFYSRKQDDTAYNSLESARGKQKMEGGIGLVKMEEPKIIYF